jgi:hypothetical protein
MRRVRAPSGYRQTGIGVGQRRCCASGCFAAVTIPIGFESLP